MAAQPTSGGGNAAYRAGLCVDCRTSRYSAGRPRCNECHDRHQRRVRGQQIAGLGASDVHIRNANTGDPTPHITVRGPGRCTECSSHVATQGHRESCSGTAPMEADEPVQELTFLQRIDARELTFLQRIDARYSGGPSPDSRSLRDLLDQRRGRFRRPQHAAGEPTAIAQPGTNPAYVAAAIRADLERLAGAHEGARNHTLITVACNVFEFVKAGHANGPAARAEIERIATAIGLPDREIQATLRSAWQRVQPRSVPAPASVAAAYTLESHTT